MIKRWIPSEEDFARARSLIRKNDEGLSEVRERILNRFKEQGVHEFFLFYSPQHDLFGAYVFYQKNKHIKEAEELGLSAKIKDAVYEALEKVGRGSRDSIKLNVEFDSHENVQENYEGDYFLRLR